MINQLTGHVINQLTGHVNNQLTGHVTNELTNDMTNQLQMCDMLLPPEVLLDAGTKATQSVVGVHHHMYYGVDESTKDS